MALPLPPGLAPAEVSFLCETELVTVIARQRLDSIGLLSGPTPILRPPHRAALPLWLALLLKKQKRANLVAPPWLHPDSLRELVRRETVLDPEQFSPPPPPPARGSATGTAHHPFSANAAADDDDDDGHNPGGGGAMPLSAPFLPSNTAAAPAGFLPYHWFEMAETLLAHAHDDMPGGAGGAAEMRGLLRDLAEVRAAKMRASTTALEGFGGGIMSLKGVGAMELAENRAFVLGVVDGVRRLGAATEAARREEEEEGGAGDEDEDDEEMGL